MFSFGVLLCGVCKEWQIARVLNSHELRLNRRRSPTGNFVVCANRHRAAIAEQEAVFGGENMGRKLAKDLCARFDETFAAGKCVAPENVTDAKRLRRACKAGLIDSPFPHLYVRAESWNAINRRAQETAVIKTIAERHPEWVFAGVSAAIVHGLEVPYALMGNIHLATKQSTHTRNRGRFVHHPMSEVPIDDSKGIRVTSLERTVFDCVRTASFRHGLAIGDSALRTSSLDVDHFTKAFEQFHKRNKGYWRAMDTMGFADARAENGGESVARAVMIEQGFMIPDLQVVVDNPLDSSEGYRVDFRWQLSTGEVYGELDGREKYTNPEMTKGQDTVDVLVKERRRESHISVTGAKIMRFAYSEAVDVDRFRYLLEAFGIPGGNAVPAVANPSDPVNQLGW